MQNDEIKVITEKIMAFIHGTTWGHVTVYFREGKIQKYEQVKTELPQERKDGKHLQNEK